MQTPLFKDKGAGILDFYDYKMKRTRRFEDFKKGKSFKILIRNKENSKNLHEGKINIISIGIMFYMDKPWSIRYKIIPAVVIGILFFSGFGTTVLSKEGHHISIQSASMSLSTPVFKETGEYLIVELEESISWMMETGKPIIPIVSKTFSFPIGTKISTVQVGCDMEKYILSKKISPSPQPLPLSPALITSINSNIVQDEEVYASAELYPSKAYIAQKKAGLNNNGEHVLFLTIQCYAQYSPVNNTIYIPQNINVEIRYEPPVASSFTADKYDMLIIAPENFSAKLQPLVDHKNSTGVRTILDTTENIYVTYNGRDEPEDIKLRIKDAIEEWNIKYVLLVGGRKGQTFDWYVPPRRINNDDGWESGYESDLYYADIYKVVENETFFEDWDSNGNNKFAEWSYNMEERDFIDYCPDVYVGRLACRNIREVSTVVNKIITYENRPKWRLWPNRMIAVGGDTFPSEDDAYEGEIETNLSTSHMAASGFEIEKLWASDRKLRENKLLRSIRRGAGFIHFAGHGNPFYWGTHPPHQEQWIGEFRNSDMNNLWNGNKLPIVVVGGCHNSQFNVTLLNLIQGIKNEGFSYFLERFWYNDWVPECWGWKMISTKTGGAVATIGNTGLGYGYPGETTLEGLGGWIEPRFFYNIGIERMNRLGEAHSETIRDYVETFDVNNDQIDRKTIEQWVLLGDPSLKLGGYE